MHGRQLSAFTLIELLVVITILGLLMAIMLTSLARVHAAGKSFVCKNQLKNVAFDFIQFADDWAHPPRGDSEKYGRSVFDIEDFQERQYGISEFWKVSGGGGYSLGDAVKYKASEQPLICPAGPQNLQKRPKLACSEGAVTPLDNVSTGFNMRLRYASVGPNSQGAFVMAQVRLSKRTMSQPTVPLVFDVDGAAAAANPLPHLLPYYSAPPAGLPGQYAINNFWYPSLRHAGRCNAAFIGGHVSSSSTPERESGWNWKYQPPVD